MVESFGSSLRRERELRFIELEEVAQATMINLRFLEAIENDDFGSLPHSTFVRGFLRAYAKYIGLDQDEVVTDYEHYLQSLEEEEGVPEPTDLKSQPNNYPNFKVWGIAVFVLLVGGLLLYLALRNREPTVSPGLFPEQPREATVAPSPERTPEPEALRQEPAEKPLVTDQSVTETDEASGTSPKAEVPVEQTPPVAPPAEEQPPAEPSGVEAPQPPSSAAEELVLPASSPAEGKGVELVIKATAQSWVLFQVDDEPGKDIIMQAGTTRTVKAQNKIVLTVGNAAGVELVLNGETLPPLGEEGKVVRGLVFEAKTKIEGQDKGQDEVNIQEQEEQGQGQGQ
jgi:cytoskeletal protein RodZ